MSEQSASLLRPKMKTRPVIVPAKPAAANKVASQVDLDDDEDDEDEDDEDEDE